MGEKELNGRLESDKSPNCCDVESVISIDRRGQMVLPKSVRDKAGIKAGDKLAVGEYEKGRRDLLHRINQN